MKGGDDDDSEASRALSSKRTYCRKPVGRFGAFRNNIITNSTLSNNGAPR
jgi:hypothetical protein